MLSERERRLLEALERQVSAEDPGLARMLAGRDPSTRWRTIGRRMTAVPALVVVMALGISGFALHLSALGLLFLAWVAIGALARHVRAGHADRGAPPPGMRHPGHRAESP